MSRVTSLIERYDRLTGNSSLPFLEDDESDLKQMFKEMIATAVELGDTEQADQLRAGYEERFGEPFEGPKAFNPEPSLETLYGEKDFEREQDYTTYHNELYQLRFETYRSLVTDADPKVSWDELVEFLKELDVAAVIGRPRGGENAWVTGKSEISFHPRFEGDRQCSLSTALHELGHILDNRRGVESMGHELFQHNMKATMYDLNSAEIYADSLKMYFVEPKFFKAGWPKVARHFDKVVPAAWKKVIKATLRKAR